MLELDLQLASNGQHPAEADFRRWCELALRQRSGDSELTIRLVDEDEGRELNRTWRHKDYATNVLSFPADVPDEFLDIPLLGDLVICVPVVEREAAEQGKTPEAHWAHLVIHGCSICSATITSTMPKPRKWKAWNAICWPNWGIPTPTLAMTTEQRNHERRSI